MTSDIKNLERYLEHSLLTIDVTEKDILHLIKEAKEYQFYGVVVNPVWIKRARAELPDSPVKLISVCGFPLGASRTDVKVIEAINAVADGADEIDMVANIGWVIDNNFNAVKQEIKIIKENISDSTVLKVIIECSKLSVEQQREATTAVVNSGADFVKTSTGFFGGATVEQVKILKESSDNKIKIKASGGIKTLEQVVELIESGADRIGTSSSIEIITQQS